MEGSVSIELEESVRELLGKRADTSFRRVVRIDAKADKQEQRILVLTDYRLYILTAKTPTKIEHNVHYLDVTCLESKKPSQVVFVTSENKRLSLSMTEKDAEEAIKYMTSQLRRAFPTTMLDQIMRMDILPSDRQRQLSIQPRESMLRDVGPCGGFTAMYEAMCDYYHQPYLDEVAWDVDTIYLSQDSKELNLSDFDHLGIKHIVPIIGTLQYDTWFTSLNANNVRLVVPPETTEAVNEVLRVMRKNTTLQELHLRNIGAKWEFAHKLAMALLHNSKSQLSVLDLSENPIEDRGVIHISGSLRQFHRSHHNPRMNHLNSPIRKLQKGLTHLNLARTGITSKGINRLADSLCANKGIAASLTHLDLSDNVLKAEDITNLYNFWAQPNVITTLRLAGTECALENLFGALLPGCCRCLTHLDLSRNVFSHRRTKDTSVLPMWKQFFATAQALKVVNLSDTKLTAEALKNVVLGISANLEVSDMELDVSSNHLRAAGADILQMVLPEIRNIHTLNISDNAFDNDMVGICTKLIQCQSIKKLLIGRNFNNIKPKHLGQVMDSVVEMIQDEESMISSLSLADSRLKNDTTIIINALGSNSSLTEIDLSGNQMSDVGARMLAKALQINTKLHTIYWDRNGTTALGFSDIAQGLTKNYSVKKMPSPINDAAVSLRLSTDKTEQALQKIEEVLKRNHSPRKLASDQGYRLHQGFLISSSQQMLDRLVVQVQEHITTLEKGSRNLTEDAKTDLRNATRLVRDASATKQILPKLQEVALQVEHEGNLIDTKLTTVSQDLHAATQRQLKRTMSDMIKCMEQQCPAIMEDTEFTMTLQTTSMDKSALPGDFTKKLLIDHVGADIMNKVSQLNLAVAAHISDRLTDGVLDSLDECHKKLTNHINSADSLTSPLKETQKPSRPEKSPAQKSGQIATPLEDDVFDEAAAQSTIKRKSLYSRRLRPQSVIDAADVKKALKMTEIDISTGGQGRLTEEEHESDSPKVEHGTKQGETNARPAVNVVASEPVEGVVVAVIDDSLANVDKTTSQGQPPEVLFTLNSFSEEPALDSDMEHKSIVVEVQGEKSEDEGKDSPKCDDEDFEVLDYPEDKVTNEDDQAEVKAATPEVKAEIEVEVKKNELKVDTDVKLMTPEIKVVTPEPEPRFKPKLQGEKVTWADSKVVSRMNAGFLAELAAGIGGRKEKEKLKEKKPGDEAEGKPSETDDLDGSRGSKELSPIPQSPGTPKSPSLSLRSASSTSDISLPPLEELPKLEHLGKSRPRRNKTRAASRAALKSDRSIEDIKEVSGGVDEFFERREVSRQYKEGAQAEDSDAKGEGKEKGDDEKEDLSKKKSWSPFNSQPNAKGLAAGISSFFGRRDKPSPTRSPELSRRLTGVSEEEAPRSPEPARRGIHKSPNPEERRSRTRTDSDKDPGSPVPTEDETKKEEDAAVPPWKRGVGLPTLPPASSSGSTSGGASALLAEMRAKRASVKPTSPTSTKSDNKENKENTKEINQSSTIPPSKENRNSIHPPASIKDRSSAVQSAALRTSASQSSTRPVPAPRSSSPANQGDKSSDKGEKSEDGSDSPSGRPRSMFLLSKPRPPPIAPKPRSKPSVCTTPSAKPTIITTPRTSDNPPQRTRSMYAMDSPKRDDGSATSGLNGRARHDKPGDSEDSQDTPNGAAKKDGEFVLFL